MPFKGEFLLGLVLDGRGVSTVKRREYSRDSLYLHFHGSICWVVNLLGPNAKTQVLLNRRERLRILSIYKDSNLKFISLKREGRFFKLRLALTQKETNQNKGYNRGKSKILTRLEDRYS